MGCMKTNEIKACPFCGADGFTQYCNSGDIGYVVRCKKLCVQLPPPWKKPYKEMDEAIKDWNKRVDNDS